jgi:hypothetical protein
MILVQKPDRKRPLGRRFVDNIKIYFKDKRRFDMDWIDVAQNREGFCEDGNVSSDSIKYYEFLSSCTTGIFSIWVQLHIVLLGMKSYGTRKHTERRGTASKSRVGFEFSDQE